MPDADQRLHALFVTSFNGTFRIEVGLGATCALVLEHISGPTNFDWHRAEFRRRLPLLSGASADPTEPTPLPDNDACYLADVVTVDRDGAQALVETVLSLPNDEQVTASTSGRDGYMVSGGLKRGDGDDPGFIAWSPTPERSPGACSFAWAVWSYAMGWTADRIGDNGLDPALKLVSVKAYLADPDRT